MTRRDEMLAAIYREHPRLRLLSTGVEAMVDWFLRDPDGFKKHMARHERESKLGSAARGHPPAADAYPKGSCPTMAECILTCVSKRSADEIEADAVSDRAQPGASVGDDVEVLAVTA